MKTPGAEAPGIPIGEDAALLEYHQSRNYNIAA